MLTECIKKGCGPRDASRDLREELNFLHWHCDFKNCDYPISGFKHRHCDKCGDALSSSKGRHLFCI